jgi:HK97 gp10 family phage protein
MNVVTLDMSGLLSAMAKVKPNSAKIVAQATAKVEAVAKTLAPVDTGALRNSLNSEQITPVLWKVQDGVTYGIYQELGTYKMAAQPFLIPAVENVSAEYIEMWRGLFT